MMLFLLFLCLYNESIISFYYMFKSLWFLGAMSESVPDVLTFVLFSHFAKTNIN